MKNMIFKSSIFIIMSVMLKSCTSHLTPLNGKKSIGVHTSNNDDYHNSNISNYFAKSSNPNEIDNSQQTKRQKKISKSKSENKRKKLTNQSKLFCSCHVGFYPSKSKSILNCKCKIHGAIYYNSQDSKFYTKVKTEINGSKSGYEPTIIYSQREDGTYNLIENIEESLEEKGWNHKQISSIKDLSNEINDNSNIIRTKEGGALSVVIRRNKPMLATSITEDGQLTGISLKFNKSNGTYLYANSTETNLYKNNPINPNCLGERIDLTTDKGKEYLINWTLQKHNDKLESLPEDKKLYEINRILFGE